MQDHAATQPAPTDNSKREALLKARADAREDAAEISAMIRNVFEMERKVDSLIKRECAEFVASGGCPASAVFEHIVGDARTPLRYQVHSLATAIDKAANRMPLATRSRYAEAAMEAMRWVNARDVSPYFKGTGRTLPPEIVTELCALQLIADTQSALFSMPPKSLWTAPAKPARQKRTNGVRPPLRSEIEKVRNACQNVAKGIDGNIQDIRRIAGLNMQMVRRILATLGRKPQRLRDD